MDIGNVDLFQVILGLAGAAVVLFIALFLWRLLKRLIGGCIAAGVGCLVLLVGLVLIALYFLSRSGAVNLQDLFGFLGP